jgi:hypothetical protein
MEVLVERTHGWQEPGEGVKEGFLEAVTPE